MHLQYKCFILACLQPLNFTGCNFTLGGKHDGYVEHIQHI